MKDRVDSSSAAEMIAIVNAVHISIKRGLVTQGDHILFQTDCQSAIDAFLNVRRKGLTEHERSARTKLFEIKRQTGFTFSFRHVKGHTDRPEARFVTNNLCDQRAKRGMRLARQKLGGNKERSAS